MLLLFIKPGTYKKGYLISSEREESPIMSCKLFRILLVQPIYYHSSSSRQHIWNLIFVYYYCCVAVLPARVAQRRAYHQHEWGAMMWECVHPETRWIINHRGNNSFGAAEKKIDIPQTDFIFIFARRIELPNAIKWCAHLARIDGWG